MATFLLSISLGEFFNVLYHSSGSKGKLLKMLGIHIQTLDVFFLFFISLILVKALFDFLENLMMSKQGELFVQAIRNSLFEQQMAMDQEEFGKRYFGKHLLKYSNDMRAVQNYLSKGIMGGTKDLIFLLMGLGVLFLINVKLSLLYAGCLFLSMILIFFVSKNQKQLVIHSRTRRSNMLALVTKSFQRHKKIKERATEADTIDKFQAASQMLYQSNMSNHRYESLLAGIFSLFQFLTITMILVGIAVDGFSAISSGNALVFILILMLMNSPFKRVMKVPGILNKGRISLDKLKLHVESEGAEDK